MKVTTEASARRTLFLRSVQNPQVNSGGNGEAGKIESNTNKPNDLLHFAVHPMRQHSGWQITGWLRFLFPRQFSVFISFNPGYSTVDSSSWEWACVECARERESARTQLGGCVSMAKSWRNHVTRLIHPTSRALAASCPITGQFPGEAPPPACPNQPD